MSEDPIDRLRDADPARGGVQAAPFEEVMEWIRHQQRVGSPKWKSRGSGWLRAVAPALGVAAVVAVVAVVVIAVGAHRPGSIAAPTRPLPASTERVPIPVSLLPTTGGMRGLVFGSSLLGAGSTLRVSFVQCTNCRGQTTPPDASEVNWSSISLDGGKLWHTAHERVLLVAFGLNLQESRDVWASGYLPHAGDQSFFVSHDSGRTYVPAKAPTNSGYTPITVGDGTVWTLGTRCVHYLCASVVLHGRASGSRLARTVVEPPGLPKRRAPTALVVAGYGDHAYVSEGAHRRFYRTKDEGHTWQQITYPCPASSVVRDLAPAGQSVWILCAPGRGLKPTTVRRSVDGGHSWQTDSTTPRDITELVAVSARVAWAVRRSGALLRSANGGRSWQTAFSGAGAAPSVDIQSATHATLVATATNKAAATHARRTDLIAYRTTNAGAHWTHTVIRLPKG